MRLEGCTAKPIGALPELGRTPPVAVREHTFERTGSSTKSPRARKNGLLRTIRQRVNGAVLTGITAALLVGGTTGCANIVKAQETPTASPTVTVQRARARYDALPPEAVQKLMQSLEKTRNHAQHIWRDVPPFNGDGTLNGYIEIPKGELTKREFDMEANALEVDRVLPQELVGYPINYGFVPQTISYDGDPFDVLVLGPAIPAGTMVKGRIVGLMYMEDEKGADMKVVMSPVDAEGKPLYRLTPREKAKVGEWFDGYKRWEADRGKWSKVNGWGDEKAGRNFVDRTHEFFEEGIERTPEVKQLRDAAAAQPSLRVLVTGFEPWQGRAQNMSGEVARQLTRTSMTGVSLETLVLPVEFERAAEIAIEKIEAFQPDIVISLGESLGLRNLELERYAENRDNDGKILDDGPDEIRTAFDMRALQRYTDEGTDALNVVLNGSPGTYVCNDLFYRLLSHFGDRGPKILFAHVPSTADRSVEDVHAAVESMLKAAVRIYRDESRPERPSLVS